MASTAENTLIATMRRNEKERYAARIEELEEALGWAIPQMRRAARTIELLAVGAKLDEKDNYYSTGLDECADSCEAALSNIEDDNTPCEAYICHGPGHQSKTRCELTGPHTIHEAHYGSYDQYACWEGDEVYSGYFDEAPCMPGEE